MSEKLHDTGRISRQEGGASLKHCPAFLFELVPGWLFDRRASVHGPTAWRDDTGINISARCGCKLDMNLHSGRRMFITDECICVRSPNSPCAGSAQSDSKIVLCWIFTS